MKLPRPFIIVAAAILFKLLLFSFAELHYPQSKFVWDSDVYLKAGQTLAARGVFAVPDAKGHLVPEFRRTPGYPAFLGVLNASMGIPLNGVILIQVLLTLLTAFFVYRTALQIDPPSAFLSALIILYSPLISIYSLLILTETLFLFLMTLFMYCLVRYLKSGNIRALLAASLMLALASYVRPGAYFLGGVVAVFLGYSNAPRDIKRGIGHALIFLLVTYGLLGIWQIRNYMLFKDPVFSSIFHEGSGFYVQIRNGRIFQGFLSLMTRPGSFKYFHCPALTIFGKITAYIWLVFWMTGFLYGIAKTGRNSCYQFVLLIILCLIGGSLFSATYYLGDRFRLPMEPFIALLSAHGWIQLALLKKRIMG